MLYTLKHPFKYTDTKECKAIEFRRPRGNEAQKLFALVSVLMGVASEGGIPDDLTEKLFQFVHEFGEIVGDADMATANITPMLDAADIFEMSGLIAENFM